MQGKEQDANIPGIFPLDGLSSHLLLETFTPLCHQMPLLQRAGNKDGCTDLLTPRSHLSSSGKEGLFPMALPLCWCIFHPSGFARDCSKSLPVTRSFPVHVGELHLVFLPLYLTLQAPSPNFPSWALLPSPPFSLLLLLSRN